MTGKLLIVGTPIGNLADFSPRGQEALRTADFIAAEDTRVTAKLLNHFAIKKELVSCYEHNERSRSGYICDRIEGGETCALVSDAGMPAISDPGETLAAECAARGIEVLAVPGPSAFTAALAVSGLPTGRFTFEGFLSMNKKSRREHLQELKEERRTMVFYEAPHKLAATLADMLTAWGDRRIALVREITKIHEEAVRTTLSGALDRYGDGSARGEFVLVIEGAPRPQREQLTEAEAVALAHEYLKEGKSAAEAAKQAAQASGRKKGEIYRALVLEQETPGRSEKEE